MELNRTSRIGLRIRTTRERHRLSIAELATRTDGLLSPSRIANFEAGIRRPGIEEIETIAAAFGDVSAAWLLTLDAGTANDTGLVSDQQATSGRR